MISIDKITKIFYKVDDFCKEYQQFITKYTLKSTNKKKIHNRKSKLSQSEVICEVICVLILFHLSSSLNLKHFQLHYLQKHLQEEFSQTVSYNRFVELQKQAIFPQEFSCKLSIWENERRFHWLILDSYDAVTLNMKNNITLLRILHKKANVVWGYFMVSNCI